MRTPARAAAMFAVGALTLFGLAAPASAAGLSISVNPYAYNVAQATNGASETVQGSGNQAGRDVVVSISTGGTTKFTQSVKTSTTSPYNWSAAFTSTQMRSLADGSYTATATESDWESSLGCLFGCWVTHTVQSSLIKDTSTPGAPTITSNNPINSNNKTAVTVSGKVTEADGLLTATLGSLSASGFAPNSDGTWSHTFDASSLADGTYSATVKQVDRGGNTSPTATKSGIIKDTVLPKLTSTSPGANGTVSALRAISMTFDSTLYGSGSIAVTNASGSAVSGATTISGSTAKWTPSAKLATGTYTATAKVYDTHGNPNTAASLTYKVDATAPTISGLTSTGTSDTKTATTVSATTSENATVTITSKDKNGKTASKTISATGGTKFSTTLSESGLAAGTITVTASAKDAYGNVGTASTTHTRTAPATTTISITVPQYTTYGASAKITGTVKLAKPGAYKSVTIVGVTNGSTKVWGTVTPSSTGAYGLTVKPTANTSFYAIYNESTPIRSSAKTGYVRWYISAASATGSHTVAAKITGTVKPAPSGTALTLYYKNSSGSWVKLTTGKVGANNAYTFSVMLPKGQTQVMVYAAASSHYASSSHIVLCTRT